MGLSMNEYRKLERYDAYRSKVGVTTVELPKDLPEGCQQQLCEVLAAWGYLPNKRQGVITVEHVHAFMLKKQCA